MFPGETDNLTQFQNPAAIQNALSDKYNIKKTGKPLILKRWEVGEREMCLASVKAI